MYKKRVTRIFVSAACCIGLCMAACMICHIPRHAIKDCYNSETNEKENASAASEDSTEHIIISLGEDAETVYISWRSDGSSPQYIRYAQDKKSLPLAKPVKADKKKTLGGKYFRYSAALADLAQGKEYYYEIGDGVSYGRVKTFNAPDESGDNKFLYLGDVQFENSVEEYKRWQKMTERVYRDNRDLDLAVIGGDMINVPTELSQWNSFLDSCKIFASLPLMSVPGNHEGVHSNGIYSKLFRLPENGPDEPAFREKDDFYTFDYGRCRFIMMDSSFLTVERQESLGQARWSILENSVERWLKRTLEDNDKTWTIVVMHHPPYGLHDSATTSPQIRTRWIPILEKGGVDMVLCGHQHMYMRTKRINGIVYVMGNSGTKKSEYYNGYNEPFYSQSIYGEGGNYQLIYAERSCLRLVSFNEKGLVIDETCIDKNLKSHILKFFGRH